MGAREFDTNEDAVRDQDQSEGKGESKPFKGPNLADFAPNTFRGDSPARRDVVEGRLPRGKVVLLAGSGGVGKSWLLLDLFERINTACESPHPEYALGGRIVGNQMPCLLLLGEDDREAVDLRLKVIRGTEGKGADFGAIVTVPNVSVPMQLFAVGFPGDTPKPTDAYDWLDESLGKMRAEQGELGFVAIDTWSIFCPVDANSPQDVSVVLAKLSHLASKHDVCVIVTHHMKKGAKPDDLRGGIRGSTAMVDGVRASYVLWHEPMDGDAELVEAAGEEPGSPVVRLSLVKDNLGLRGDDVTFIRRKDGTLRDVSQLVRGQMSPPDALLAVIAAASVMGEAMTKSGKNGVFSRRSDSWPPLIKGLARGRLESMCQGLIDKRLLIKHKDGTLHLPEG